jgi:hypothetical protein
MARIQKPTAGRLIVSYIYASVDALAESLSKLERVFGPVQFETMDIPCAAAQKYSEEMGHNLQRRFFSFENPVPRDSLPSLKRSCSKIEPSFADDVAGTLFRTVNIDPGILTPDNLIMASYREFNHRIYLGDGVFSDIQLIYSLGKFTRLPWTNPDFCHEEAIDFFQRVRATFELIDEKSQVPTGLAS